MLLYVFLNIARIILDIINKAIICFSRYCTHSKIFLPTISLKLEVIKAILKVKQEDIFFKQILKKGIDQKLDDFLNIT